MRPVLLCALVGAAIGLSASAPQDLSSARDRAAALPRLHSLLASHRGRLVLEYYAPRHGAARLANIKSASKSIISALVGIAIERRLIEKTGADFVVATDAGRLMNIAGRLGRLGSRVRALHLAQVLESV